MVGWCGKIENKALSAFNWKLRLKMKLNLAITTFVQMILLSFNGSKNNESIHIEDWKQSSAILCDISIETQHL